ncbi:MAG: hypothetical protein U0802_00700 [Candidatus Binatia bacterium]
MDDDALADREPSHLAADPVHDAGDLVPETERPVAGPAAAAEADEREIGAADAARGDAHDGVARPRPRRRDLVEPHVARAVYPHLAHAHRTSGRICGKTSK